MAETIQFQTSDGVLIVGDWYAAQGDVKATILLLHMMPADRRSWQTFANKLTAAGYNALAIDERGHGDSTRKGNEVLNYEDFGAEDQLAKMLDIEAALAWLADRGVNSDAVGVIGGSIGANLAITLGAKDSHIRAIGALSPGLNYRGVKTKPAAKALQGTQSLFMAAAMDDTHTSVAAINELATISGAPTVVSTFESGGHATDLFTSHPELMDDLIAWLDGLYT